MSDRGNDCIFERYRLCSLRILEKLIAAVPLTSVILNVSGLSLCRILGFNLLEIVTELVDDHGSRDLVLAFSITEHLMAPAADVIFFVSVFGTGGCFFISLGKIVLCERDLDMYVFIRQRESLIR